MLKMLLDASGGGRAGYALNDLIEHVGNVETGLNSKRAVLIDLSLICRDSINQ